MPVCFKGAVPKANPCCFIWWLLPAQHAKAAVANHCKRQPHRIWEEVGEGELVRRVTLWGARDASRCLARSSCNPSGGRESNHRPLLSAHLHRIYTASTPHPHRICAIARWRIRRLRLRSRPRSQARTHRAVSMHLVEAEVTPADQEAVESEEGLVSSPPPLCASRKARRGELRSRPKLAGQRVGLGACLRAVRLEGCVCLRHWSHFLFGSR